MCARKCERVSVSGWWVREWLELVDVGYECVVRISVHTKEVSSSISSRKSADTTTTKKMTPPTSTFVDLSSIVVQPQELAPTLKVYTVFILCIWVYNFF